MTTSAGPRSCDIAECPNEAQKGGLCWTHLWRRRNGLPMSAPVRRYSRDAKEGLRRALDSYMDALDSFDSDEPAQRVEDKAWRRLLMAIAYYRRKQMRKRRSESPPAG